MGAKDYLGRIRHLSEEINLMFEELERLESVATKTTSLPFNAVKVESTKQEDRTASIVSKMVDLKQELCATVSEFIDLKAEVIALIDELPDNKHKVLMLNRHLNLKTWSEVAKVLEMSVGGCHVMHRKALIEFEKVLQEKEMANNE